MTNKMMKTMIIAATVVFVMAFGVVVYFFASSGDDTKDSPKETITDSSDKSGVEKKTDEDRKNTDEKSTGDNHTEEKSSSVFSEFFSDSTKKSSEGSSTTESTREASNGKKADATTATAVTESSKQDPNAQTASAKKNAVADHQHNWVLKTEKEDHSGEGHWEEVDIPGYWTERSECHTVCNCGYDYTAHGRSTSEGCPYEYVVNHAPEDYYPYTEWLSYGDEVYAANPETGINTHARYSDRPVTIPYYVEPVHEKKWVEDTPWSVEYTYYECSICGQRK